MNENAIQQMIEALDAEIVEAGDAKLCFTACQPKFLLILTANRVGLLKLARTLLQAALEPLLAAKDRSRPVRLGEDCEQVREGEDDRALVGIIRTEDWPAPIDHVQQQIKSSWRQRAGLLGCGIVVCILLAIFITGIVTIWQAL